MGLSERNSPQGAERVERWLGPERTVRSRRWAYPDILLGGADPVPAEDLAALSADLAYDLAELRRLQNDLHDQVVRVAALEGRVQALLHTTEIAPNESPSPPEEATTLPSFPSTGGSDETRDRSALLAHCEGFEVDSPVGLVGFVEGLRFGSRIDAPDLLEVRGGRLGRELLLIPVEAVDAISREDERLVVHGVSPIQTDISHELVDRLRRALHVMSASIR
jgi:hypothetical protein